MCTTPCICIWQCTHFLSHPVPLKTPQEPNAADSHSGFLPDRQQQEPGEHVDDASWDLPRREGRRWLPLHGLRFPGDVRLLRRQTSMWYMLPGRCSDAETYSKLNKKWSSSWMYSMSLIHTCSLGWITFLITFFFYNSLLVQSVCRISGLIRCL